MDHFDPNHLEPGSPNELMLFLDSVITSSLCPHTKDWVCLMYIAFHHRQLCQLNISFDLTTKGDLFTVKYGGKGEKVPFRIHELVAYVQGFPGLKDPIIRLDQAQSVKRASAPWWDYVARGIVSRIPLMVRLETPKTGSYALFPDKTGSYALFPDKTGSYVSLIGRNPAVWLAVQGQYTMENFITGRSLNEFIEDHYWWLSSRFGRARSGDWEHHKAFDHCRCPGYELPHLLADAEPNKAADIVREEIFSHIDPLIVQHLRPALESYEKARRHASYQNLDSRFPPQASSIFWDLVTDFKVSSSVMVQFSKSCESLRNNAEFRSMAEARVAAES